MACNMYPGCITREALVAERDLGDAPVPVSSIDAPDRFGHQFGRRALDEFASHAAAR